MQTNIQTDKETQTRHKIRETDRQTGRGRNRDIHTHIKRQAYRHTDRTETYIYV